ncbi:MAG: hypothetical protein MK102_08230 [Fuerstiella sp.]|nr:hypothetical protein [Fuerstiella sp.]
MKPYLTVRHNTSAQRRGSTLVIVISMLGLLSFMGTVFYLFAIQERSNAENFSAAAKVDDVDLDDPFPWGLRQLINGPEAFEKFSILGDATSNNRHSMIRNLIGPDVTPYTGLGVRVVYGGGLPITDADYNLSADDPLGNGAGSGDVDNLLNFNDSIAAWGDTISDEGTLAAARDYAGVDALPYPDVDYTAPDINNLFLAYKGWAIRDNGAAASPRYERVQVIIPSFFRPQYLKSSATNSSGGKNVPTDHNWYDPVAHPEYQRRSFRPHKNHIGGKDAAGNPVYRFLETTRDSGGLPTAGAFPFVPGEGDNTANFGKLGVWTGDVPEDSLGFELDSDNDGDGIKEGIWMDLQYPIQETTDGRFYATLHSFTIYDLDALLDLNAVGNLAQLPRNGNINGTVVGAGNLMATIPLSDSNQGLGPNEISPIYALLPDTPGTANAFSDWYGANPSNALEQANMEFAWLLGGRMDFDTPNWTDLYPGRWGDANALVYHKVSAGSSVSTLPRPGVAGDLTSASSSPSFGGANGRDDNLDSLEGIASTVTGVLRGFQHPMDFAGKGTNRLAADFRLPNMLQNPAGSPEAWLLYGGYSAVGTAAANYSRYMRGIDGILGNADDLSISHFIDALFEDPLEMIMDLDFAVRPDDEMFSVQDMLIGHLTETDKNAAQGEVSERLRKLMPMTYAAGSDRTDRFTTLTHSFRHVPFLEQPAGPRSWEWSADADGDGAMEFPPKFGSVLPYSAVDPFRPEVRRLLTIEAGEQRESLGQLLLSINHILDVNRATNAPADDSPEYLAHMQQFGLTFRKLVEHPDDSAAGTVTSMPTIQPAFPPQNPADQEYWARRDRQKLARDIYVLLYTLGGAEVSGTNIVDYTQTNNSSVAGANRPRYTEARLRQMAQFAVNMVDAMDTDNVITRFEYDKNLRDGWKLDDLPWTSTDPASADTLVPTNVTANGLYPEDAGNRGVVYGVEAQQLAFSEVLAVHSPDFTPSSFSDDPATEYDDTNGNRYMLHVELQNMLPMPLDLDAGVATASSNEDYGLWRLARFDRSGASNVQAANADQTLTLMQGNGTLAGGGRFTIATAGLDGTPAATNPTGFGTADFYMDADTDANFNLISPDGTTGTITSGATPAPLCGLDLIHATHNNQWLLSGNSTDRGRFLDTMQTYQGNADFGITSVSGLNGPRNGFDLVLQRRQNPNLPQLPLTHNPWIEVDRIKAEFTELYDISGGGPVLNLASVKSLERHEPLNGQQSTGPADTGVKEYDAAKDPGLNLVDRLNTLGTNVNSVTNDGTPAIPRFELWQAHFDRDFASSGELLNLPIVGPKLLTRSIDRMRYAGFQQAHPDPAVFGGVPDPDLITGAAGMFLHPDLPTATLPVDRANAWYRLMQFVEVPSRVNRMLGNYINLQRLPGKLNLNTIRHRQVYAGLLDDLNIANLPVMTDADGNGDLNGPFLTSTTPDGNDVIPGLTTGRDRWLELINERDGYVRTVNGDTGAATDMWLPGTPNSRPFRSMAYTRGTTAPGNDIGLDETILRRVGADRQQSTSNAFGESPDDTTTNRHLLEAGTDGFHRRDPLDAEYNTVVSGATANMVHRHQFLSKIMNNTTTTSNCFIVYGTAAYFEAVLDPSGVFRIGGRMGLDLDGNLNEKDDAGWEQRAVFVIDRTEAFNAFDSASGEIEWERLIKHRLDLASDGQ